MPALVDDAESGGVVLLARNIFGRLEPVADADGRPINLRPEIIRAESADLAERLARRYVRAASILEFPPFPATKE
jgi:hypothetical protein